MISGSEVALFSLNQTDLDDLSKKNSSTAKVISELLAKPKKLLATILVANNFINIGIVILFSYSLNSVFSVIESTLLKFIVEVVLVTFLLLLFGEVLPKVYASRNNVKFASFIAYPISILDKVLSPVSIPLRSITNFIQEKL